MAINILQGPQDKMPTSNPIMLIVSGSNHTQLGYQYIYNLYKYEGGLVGTLIKSDKRPPSPAPSNMPSLSGLGIIDFSRPLRDYTLSDFNPLLTGFTSASGSMISYSYTINEEYIIQFPYTRTSGATSGGWVVFVNTGTTTHPFVAGDIVNVIQSPTNNSNIAYYSGIHIVQEVYSNKQFSIDIGYFGDFFNDTGIVTFANNKKTSPTEPVISGVSIAFNGAIPMAEFPKVTSIGQPGYSASTYTLNGYNPIGKLLTNMPQNGWQLRENSRAQYNFFQDISNQPFAVVIRTHGPRPIGKQYSITAATWNFGVADFNIIDNGFTIPDNVLFSYVVDDGSPLGMANSGTGSIVSSTGSTYTTTVPSTVPAGAFLNGTLTITPHISVTSAVGGINGGFADFYLVDYQNTIPNGTTFQYSVTGGSVIGMANSGYGTILGYSGSGIYATSVPAPIVAGGVITGIMTLTFGNEYVEEIYTMSGNTVTGSYPNLFKEVQAGLGPWNLNNNPNLLPQDVIKSSTTGYDFYLISDYGNNNYVSSQVYSIDIDRRCSYYNRDEIELLFKDNLGSFQSFTFQLKNTKTTDIQRQEYKKQIGSYQGYAKGWTYNPWDRGWTGFDIDTQDNYTAICDWITTDSNIEYLRSLFDSSEVYWVFDQDANVILPIRITSKTYETKKIINERLVNAEINFQLAFAEPRNI